MKRYTFSTLILSFFLSFHIATADTPSRRVEGSHQQSVAPTAGDYARLFSDLANPDEEVRSRAFEQLTDALERRSQSAIIVQLAIHHLNDNSTLVRSRSAVILGFAGTDQNMTTPLKQQALQSLISHVQKEQEEGVRGSIARALGRFAWETDSASRSHLDSQKDIRRTVLRQIRRRTRSNTCFGGNRKQAVRG